MQKRSDDQPYDGASEVYRGQHVRSHNDIYSEEIMCDQFDFEDVASDVESCSRVPSIDYEFRLQVKILATKALSAITK